MDETRGSAAADRARSAGRRVDELEERLRRLRAGEPVSDEDVLKAEQAAVRGGERSAQARRSTYLAYRRAAESHRATARALDASGRREEAAEHRRLAEEDDRAAEAHSHPNVTEELTDGAVDD